MKLSTQDMIRIAAFYKFAPLADPAELRTLLLDEGRARGLRGTIIVAGEGVNGTVGGSPAAIAALLDLLGEHTGLGESQVKFSEAATGPFRRYKVRLKREIVTMGVPGVDPGHGAIPVDPADWNRLIADPDTMVVDTRNAYETRVGTFAGATDPQTGSFREFPAWAEANRDALGAGKVAMFCTGGIRCEKAGAYLRSIGVEEVYQLKGGILRYLETVPEDESLWRGECFVFDERVAVSHGLAAGDTQLCRACRGPLTPEDRRSPLHVVGEACPHCHGLRSEADRSRYRERHRQVEIAARRGLVHIGD